ncbi:MAG: sugar phosphate isomerase/epimerase family protein [Candidatus Latescibacteria bacterium]|jgi:sugar phosphate isomerase/epimerase|nr:sugar phosphate isomerase/epimerase family protein [Candidatus Latescibacterota bacterium]
MKLGYMTFVCPEWKIERVVEFAKEAGYDGVEIRVDAGHQHEISSESTAETRQSVKKLFADQGIEIPAVATSVMTASPDPQVHQEHIDAGKANLDLAANLGAGLVRIFAGGKRPEFDEQAADQIAAAFDELGEHAKGSGVSPMLECGHDIIKGATEAAEVIKRVTTSNFAVLWNHAEMDDATYDALESRLRHFHVHDDALDPESPHMRNLAHRMVGLGFQGFVNLEIIKGHNLPEDVLKETAKRIKGYFAEA